MKKILCALLAVGFVLTVTAVSYARQCKAAYDDDGYAIETDQINYETTAVNKLGRGLVNTATFWAEVPAEMAKVSKNSDPVLGCTLGVAQGTVNALIRGVTGVFDAVTFLVPPYDKPLMRPEYALNSADAKMKEYLW